MFYSFTQCPTVMKITLAPLYKRGSNTEKGERTRKKSLERLRQYPSRVNFLNQGIASMLFFYFLGIFGWIKPSRSLPRLKDIYLVCSDLFHPLSQGFLNDTSTILYSVSNSSEFLPSFGMHSLEKSHQNIDCHSWLEIFLLVSMFAAYQLLFAERFNMIDTRRTGMDLDSSGTKFTFNYYCYILHIGAVVTVHGSPKDWWFKSQLVGEKNVY